MSQTRSSTTIALVASLLALASCGSSGPPDEAEDVYTTWRNAGIEVRPHSRLAEHALGDARCERGTTLGVETTLCTYPDEEAARAARSAGLAVIGDTTGAALARGRVLLVAVDRNASDPNGKAIHALTKSFLGR